MNPAHACTKCGQGATFYKGNNYWCQPCLENVAQKPFPPLLSADAKISLLLSETDDRVDLAHARAWRTAYESATAREDRVRKALGIQRDIATDLRAMALAAELQR